MKPIVVDYRNRTISLSSAFEKKAFTPGTAEYAQLQSVRVDFPYFRLSTREFKTNTKQDRHKGLTYKFMREYTGWIKYLTCLMRNGDPSRAIRGNTLSAIWEGSRASNIMTLDY